MDRLQGIRLGGEMFSGSVYRIGGEISKHLGIYHQKQLPSDLPPEGEFLLDATRYFGCEEPVEVPRK